MPFHPVFDFRPAELARFRSLPVGLAIADAAAARDGVLCTRQLVALGVSRAAVARRAERGLLHPRHRAVFAVGRADLTRRGEMRAALLRYGRGAVLSHRTAAWLLDLLAPQGRVDVTVTGRPDRPGGRSAVALDYTRRWLPSDVVLVDGLPCTSISRTLADLAAGRPEREFTTAWDNADRMVVLDVGPLATQVARRRTGSAALRARLERHDATPPDASVLELRFLTLCDAFGLGTPVREWPLPSRNRVGRVDFVWPGPRVAVEVDGRRWHAIQAAFERDREKDLELREAGFDPHRYTYRQICDEPGRVAAAIRQALR